MNKIIRKYSIVMGVIISTLLFSVQNIFSIENIIPEDRRINWQPGLPNEIPNYSVSVNVKDFGAAGDGITDDTQPFKNAISAASEGTAILIPEGNYKITSELRIGKGIVLRGEGFNKTKLLFNFSEGGSCVTIVKYGDSDWTNIVSGAVKGSNVVTVANPTNFKAGNFVEIKQDNDPAVYSPGALGSFDDAAVGQMLVVSQVSGNTITFNKELYYTYNYNRNPRMKKKAMVQGAGVEMLYIERVNSSPWGSNIVIKNTAYSWVSNVWSEKTLTTHIFLSAAYRNEIRGCYFHDSFLHGSGGQGYGIRCEARSTDNLIENNIFERLRHSMVVQLGATGNVFGYNYSKDPFFEEGNNWLMQDIAIHGHYTYMNLFEGNTVQCFVADNVWGTNGPTTLFRNRVEKNVGHYLDNTDRFPFMDIKENNFYHNIIGNELGIEGTFADEPLRVDPSIDDVTILHSNYIYQNNSLEFNPSINDHNIPNSLYLSQKPSWFGNFPWPVLGGDISPNSNIIPAQQRYQSSQFIVGPPEPPKNLRANIRY